MSTIDTKMNPEVRRYREYMEAAVDYCEKPFQLAARMYRLWRGHIPELVDLTFAKMMINYAYAAVQDRIPKQLSNLFSAKKLFDVVANDPQSEIHADEAESWLNSFFMDSNKINIQRSIIPTLQSVNIMGTGYRMPCLTNRKTKSGKWEQIITSRDVDFFQILPCPLGGELNPLDRWSNDALPWFIMIDWMTDEQIKAYEKHPGYNQAEAQRCFNAPHETDANIDTVLHEKYRVIAGVNYGMEAESYRRKMNEIDGAGKKRRVAHLFSREKWQIIVQDSFLVFDGENPIGDGILPLVKYAITPDIKDWFGIGAIEMLEDIYITAALNTNFRFDYLAKAMFPAKWIRDDVMGNRPESDFYDRPYAVHRFPVNARIQDAVWVDRMPEINQQTFLEEDRLSNLTQEISGMPNYQRGMSGTTPSNDTASGILSLIQQAQGRLGMESMILEWDGLAQEGRLVLLLAQNYIKEPYPIRTKGGDGWNWTTIDPIAFEGSYTVYTHGTRYLEQREQAFQKILAMYPYWSQDHQIDQYEFKKQAIAKTDVFDMPDKILLPRNSESQIPQEMGGSAPSPGGAASVVDILQRINGVNNRNTVEPGTGNLVPVTGEY